jgi:NAD(P)-dependent dehydrogenase (short-subunit alcohol dehydrogenase family)
MAKLDGKVAVITGGSSGIGLATAKTFANEGAYVFIFGRRQSELDRAKAAIGRNVATVQGDVAKLEDLDRLFGQVKAEKGGLDVLVVSAGFVEMAPMAAVTPEHFDKTFAINARGAFFTVQKAVPLMRDGGSIVLYQTYGATKAALRFWARSMAAELKDRSIRVNTLSPGAIDTPIMDGQFKTKKEADAGREMFKQMTPLGRIGRPEEMAKAILFLGSDDSSYTTGSDLVADGGLTQL